MRTPVAGFGSGLLLMAVLASRAAAQADADSSVFFTEPGMAALPFSIDADIRVWAERVQGLPAGREDFERLRAALRLGASYLHRSGLGGDAGIRAALGSDDNDDNIRNFDNQRSDAFELDRAQVRWQPIESTTLSAGAMPLPLRTTALWWDEDLRPVGVAWVQRGAWRTYDTWRLVGGYFGVSPLGGHDARAAVAQLSWRMRDGAPRGGEATVSFLSWDRLEPLAREGFLRQNRSAPPAGGPGFRSDFELLDLQLGARTPIAGVLVEVLQDVVVNVGAASDRIGSRSRAALGVESGAARLELGYVYQSIDQDAVLGAVNSDDWWFHSRARGHSAWLSAGLAEALELRLIGFRERRDDLGRATTRVTLEAIGRLPAP
jgi:hypothetical protein